MKRYLVIGLNAFGAELACRLTELGHEVLAVDSREAEVRRASERGCAAVTADACDREMLQSLDVCGRDLCIVAMEDPAGAAVAVLNLRELGAGEILCRACDENQSRVMLRLGADRVILPEQETALWVARSLSGDCAAEETLRASVQIPAPAAWIGRSLGEMNVRASLGLTVLAVQTPAGIVSAPGADYVVKEDDIMVVLGDRDALSAVTE